MTEASRYIQCALYLKTYYYSTFWEELFLIPQTFRDMLTAHRLLKFLCYVHIILRFWYNTKYTKSLGIIDYLFRSTTYLKTYFYSTFWEELLLIPQPFRDTCSLLTFSKKFSMVNLARNFLYSALSCSSWNLICSFLSFDTPPTLWDNLSSAIKSFLANLKGWPPPPSILAEKDGCSLS